MDTIKQAVDRAAVNDVKRQKMQRFVRMDRTSCIIYPAPVCFQQSRTIPDGLYKLIAHPVIDLQVHLGAAAPVVIELHTISESLGLKRLIQIIMLRVVESRYHHGSRMPA